MALFSSLLSSDWVPSGFMTVCAVGPGDRPPGEDLAATAVTAEERAVDVAAELADRACLVGELLERRRRLLGVQAGLAVQRLVVHPDRQVDDEGQAVLLALPGRDVDGRRRDVR